MSVTVRPLSIGAGRAHTEELFLAFTRAVPKEDRILTIKLAG